jgi:hypothetical protein
LYYYLVGRSHTHRFFLSRINPIDRSLEIGGISGCWRERNVPGFQRRAVARYAGAL